MVCCVVQTCTRRSETSNRKKDGVSFHAFPKSPTLRNEWAVFCRRAPSWQPKRTSVICSDHFDPSSFQTLANQRRLVGNAIPTIMLSGCKAFQTINISLESETHQDKEMRIPSPTIAINGNSSTSNQNYTHKHLEIATQHHNTRVPSPLDSEHGHINPELIILDSQLQQQSQLPSPTHASPDQLSVQAWKKKLQLKNSQIKKLQDNNRYLKIKVNNLQTVCARLKKLLTKKMH